MPQNTHLEVVKDEAQRHFDSSQEISQDLDALRAHAKKASPNFPWLPNTKFSSAAEERFHAAVAKMQPLLEGLNEHRNDVDVSDDFRWLRDNVRLFHTAVQDIGEDLQTLSVLPHVRTPSKAILPRPLAIAEEFLVAAHNQFTEEAVSAYVSEFQKFNVLNLKELPGLVSSLKLVLLEQNISRGLKLIKDPKATYDIAPCIRSLRDVGQANWKEVLEPLVVFDQVLRQDPAGTYPRMDFESRQYYRNEVIKIAERSDMSEVEVATQAIALARDAARKTEADPRVTERHSHVGYYIVAEGAKHLHQRVGFRPAFGQRVTMFLRRHPDDFYVPGISLLTLLMMATILLAVRDPYRSFTLYLLSMVVLLLPCSQSAVQIMTYLVTSILPARILPKLDFSKGIPDDCMTMVAVPSLLINEKQVRRLVENLEIRYIGNHDPNMHFALVTDLPDATEPSKEDDPLVELCSELIKGLNEKHGGEGQGLFLLLHRHRIYNPREGVWMGWERKRGKLMDLNKLMRGEYDSFPVKVGDLAILPKVRFIITLDADTELPRGSAHRMVGAMAHSLNQGIVDPERNIVVAGYGILQPRVGVSVESASRSRLAGIFSGETGFDIYTRAVSDVYQDLYGEGSFTGKGIYEIETIHRVLDRRFPRNALLSHDLIEGAYARAGLVSDIEVIEDYPSHYSAYNRRKHRWLRGDWQIAGWLFPRVFDESGALVPNPISVISQWKILDNLRRSLVEPASFMLLVLGWMVLPGSARYWTIASIVILFLPAILQLAFTLVRSVVESSRRVAQDAFTTLGANSVNVLLTLTFLPHQMLLSFDAVVRSLVRRMVTGRRLLEWETAEQAELGERRSPADSYLNWVPAIAVGLGVLIYFFHHDAFYAALPILLLWACSKPFSVWLNNPSQLRYEATENDELFLRRAALRTWRYFSEFCTAEHNWLIPDNVQEDPAAIAPRVSPTNLGLLLNARQVACEFGYLTVPEYADLTLRTLNTMELLPRYRGQLLNWYDTRTLATLPPAFVSSVDSGNLVASLWTLEQGTLERLQRPLLEPILAEGFFDHLRILVDLHEVPRKLLARFDREMHEEEWLRHLLELPDNFLDAAHVPSKSKPSKDVEWFAAEAVNRLRLIKRTVQDYAPWLLLEFAPLWEDPALKLEFASHSLSLGRLPQFIDKLAEHLEFVGCSTVSETQKSLCERLRALLPGARSNASKLTDDLRGIAAEARRFANAMDFRFLLNRRRKLLSVGYDVDLQELHSACYDLLATESRTAVFAAIAKEDIPQESWFMLGRAHTLDKGRPVLLSWTGTMFEYLMPALWMRTYPNTLLDRSRVAVVRSQQAYTAAKRIPWGISESAHFQTDPAGNYQYYAFGLPQLALRSGELNKLVISPYSTFLAMHVDAPGSVANLRKMSHDGWFGPYGFYESADYSASKRSWRMKCEVVRCWMAHHQGMILLSIANFLHDGVVQRWFHSDPRVQATELLLHEKPVAHVRVTATGNEAQAAD
jgi:hypothetical protein